MAATHRNETYFDYVIVGGGCLGASSALALIHEWPDAKIIWFEGTDPHTASKDINKIIRTPYPDEDYVAFAGKALKMWQTESPYKNYYHQTGWVYVVAQGSIQAKGPNDRMMSVEEMKTMVGSQEIPKLEAGEEMWLNEDIGYADFKLAVGAVAGKASLLGVTRMKEEVTKLIVNEGVCQGVEVGDDRFLATKTIVAAGPWTPRILERSEVGFPSDFFTVAGVGVATIDLEEKEFHELKSMPIIVTGGGEIMPSRIHKSLKVTTTNTFRIKHPDELEDLESFGVWTNRALLEKMLPQFAGRKLSWWICPDLMTPYQHPLVDQVPGMGHLYLVVGGSYHSAKFLPNIGDMLVRRLHGQTGLDTLEDRLLKRWSWNRTTEEVAVHGSVVPKNS